MQVFDFSDRERLMNAASTGDCIAPRMDIQHFASDSPVWISSSARRVPARMMRKVAPAVATPVAGDIVVARVESIGKNARLELPTGRAKALHVGDRIVAVFGNRYATNQFEGYARSDGDSCDMLSMGGLCGLVASTHTSMKEPTRLRVLGAVTDDAGKPLHLRHFSLKAVAPPETPHVTAVCGTTMDSGKTHTVISVIRGLKNAGKTVAAIKLTGTACCQDTWKMHDAGASPVFDFVDGGYPSTYLCTVKELHTLYELLRGHAAATGVDHIVVEIADGLLQQETAALLRHSPFVATVNAWVLAASDPLGVAGGVAVMRQAGIEPLIVSGLISCSQLAMREAEAVAGIRCMTAEDIMMGALNVHLVREDGVPTMLCKEAVG